MKKLLFVILLLFLGIRTYSFVPTENTQISILVCSPGEDLYAKFGHAALRIHDEEQHFDFVFDYGTFSIDDLLQFIGNFFTGKTYYVLDAKDFRYTKLAYEFEGRGIVEYPLELSREETVNICNFIRNNMLLKNRPYLYNFFYDNCATRLRDILSSQIDGLSWNAPYEEETWRSVIVRYVGETSMPSLGIHLALGLPTDALATKDELLFLPDAIGSVCQTATRADGRKLCGEPQIIVEHSQKAVREDFACVLWCLFVLILLLTVVEMYKKKWFVWLDAFLLFVFGIAGCALWFLSFVSIHSLVFPNCNTLWLTPFHLIFAFLLFIPSLQKYTKWYVVLASIMAILFVVVSQVVGQFIPISVYPLLLVLIVRGMSLLYSEICCKNN